MVKSYIKIIQIFEKFRQIFITVPVFQKHDWVKKTLLSSQKLSDKALNMLEK